MEHRKRAGGRRLVLALALPLVVLEGPGPSFAAGREDAEAPSAARALRAEEEPSLGSRPREILDGIARYAPHDFPDRWLHELGVPRERQRLLRSRLITSVSWIHFLAFANAFDWSDGERARTEEWLLESLPRTASGKVRQNLVFLLALTSPRAAAALADLAEREDLAADDRADARSALAALGDERAIDWFARELAPSQAFVGRELFDFDDYAREELQEKSRPAVRSYRLWEVLFRRPYFHRLKLLARGGIYSMQARGMGEAERGPLVARLVPLFLAKWPGHPGSDNASLWLMHHAIERRDLLDAYLWAQRASLLPDQDCGPASVRVLEALAESQLRAADIDALILSEDGRQNRDFLLYERFLKTARGDAAAGLEYFDRLAAREPAGLFAAARRQAAGVEPTGALRDGVREDLSLELLRTYPERSRRLAETPVQPATGPSESDFLQHLTGRERQVVLRTKLARRDSVLVPVPALARQYRLLLELQHLREMEAGRSDPEDKADLRYRQAKLFYREWDAFFPVWAEQSMAWGHALNAARFDERADERLEGYAAEAFALRRAFDALLSLRADYPRYRGMASVAFHAAQAYAKLMDYHPAKALDVWIYPDRPPAGSREGMVEYGHRRVGELFGQVAAEFPDSEWADESERGATWRLKMAELLRFKRERADREAEAERRRQERRGF